MMNDFVGKDKDLKFYSGFNREPEQRSQYGGKMVSDPSSCLLLQINSSCSSFH